VPYIFFHIPKAPHFISIVNSTPRLRLSRDLTAQQP
jgi:hypothetical protein